MYGYFYVVHHAKSIIHEILKAVLVIPTFLGFLYFQD